MKKITALFANPGLFLVFCFVLFLNGSCKYSGAEVIRGDGNLVTKSFEADYFHSIELKGAFNVTLGEGERAHVTLETDSNLHELIEIYVEQNILYVSGYGEQALKPTKMDVSIVYPDLHRVNVSGACKITSPGKVVTDELVFDLSGASDIELELTVNKLTTRVAGAANIHLMGNAQNHSIDLAGASNLKAEKLITESTSINLSGAGSATVYASSILNASMSGFGRIHYHGNPTETNINKSGFGTIRSAGK